ncbi:MAG: phosphoribosylaminoimidazolesuccinocarboxamide synthase [Thermonemataceae bacterium]
MVKTIRETHFQFPNQQKFYKGKVRDVYYFEDLLAIITTDRISAFDVILPAAIPYKGAILNKIALINLAKTEDIVENWLIGSPHPNVAIGYACEPFPIEMVVRGYLAGHAWRLYKEGIREICGIALPEGLQENDPLPSPILTPTTKAQTGHDQDISKEAIIQEKLVEANVLEKLEGYSYQLYQRGSQIAKEKNLILVDTKYEFGVYKGKIKLIDEIHTPDSSRYFYADSYEARQSEGLPQKQLSKEFVRQWLIEEGFQGKAGQSIPDMNEKIVAMISQRYKELYSVFVGKPFEENIPDIDEEVITKYIEVIN